MKGQAAQQAGAAGAAVAGTGAALGAAAASACCVGPVVSPLIVGLLGAGGAAWAASLKPYSAYLLGGSLLQLACAFWSAYRRPTACAIGDGSSAAVRSPQWLRGLLWLSALLWVAAFAVNLVLGAG